jgi:hypothetical protein
MGLQEPDLSGMEPVANAAPAKPAAPPFVPSEPEFNPLQRSSLPTILNTPPDQLRQFYSRSGVPQSRVLPQNPAALASHNSAASSQAIVVQQSGQGLTLQTNNVKNPVQNILNLIGGNGISLVANNAGGVTINGSGGGDGLTHGTTPWEYDPGYMILREDFTRYTSTSQIGELGWALLGTTAESALVGGGVAGHWGSYAWDNPDSASNFGMLALNSSTFSNGTLYQGGLPLLDYPGWKATFVFKLDGALFSTGDFQTGAKSVYIGMTGITTPLLSNISARPDIFLGVRYDTSATPGTLTLSSVANASGGTTDYTGTITGGADGAYIGLTFVVAGFGTGANNGSFLCTQSSGSILTLANAAGVAESHAATATASGLNDSFYTLEVVENITYSSPARHNKQGTTLVTTVAPTMGVWHRLDIVCNTAGSVTLTLDGSATNTLTAPISQMTLSTGASGQVSVNNGMGRFGFSVGTSGTNGQPVCGADSIVTISGLTSGNAPLNGTWTLSDSSNPNFFFDATGVSNIGNNTAQSTIVSYPSLIPAFLFGNDDNGSPSFRSLRFYADFFSMAANVNLGPSAPGTPDPTKARYF